MKNSNIIFLDQTSSDRLHIEFLLGFGQWLALGWTIALIYHQPLYGDGMFTLNAKKKKTKKTH
jgi:hypothetical protein